MLGTQDGSCERTASSLNHGTLSLAPSPGNSHLYTFSAALSNVCPLLCCYSNASTGPPPPALRLLCTRDARSGRRGAPPRPRARARARRAQGARARPPRARRGLACCCPGKACSWRGARLGASRRGSGEPSGRPGACTLAVPVGLCVLLGGKDSRAAAGKGIVLDYARGFSPPLADPRIPSLPPGGEGALPQGRRSSARALCLI